MLAIDNNPFCLHVPDLCQHANEGLVKESANLYSQTLSMHTPNTQSEVSISNTKRCLYCLDQSWYWIGFVQGMMVEGLGIRDEDTTWYIINVHFDHCYEVYEICTKLILSTWLYVLFII